MDWIGSFGSPGSRISSVPCYGRMGSVPCYDHKSGATEQIKVVGQRGRVEKCCVLRARYGTECLELALRVLEL